MRINRKRGVIVLGRDETRRLEARGPYDGRDSLAMRSRVFEAAKVILMQPNAPGTVEAYACKRAGGWTIDIWEYSESWGPR